MNNNRGSVFVEFILAVPFLAFLTGAFVWLTVQAVTRQLSFAASFGGARWLAMYDTVHAQESVRRLHPRWDGRLEAALPLPKALEGITQDLNDKNREDNPILYCGNQGDYHLCSR